MPRRRKSLKPYTPRQRQIRYLAGKGVIGLLVIGLLVALAVVDRMGVFGRADEPDWVKYHEKTFRVVKVVDGDTLDVDIPDGDHDSTRIRLWGVDTPETVKPDTPVQHYGPEATRFVRRAADCGSVTLRLNETRTRGKFGRLLAYVILPDGRNLNRELIATGHGYADPRFEHPLKREFKLAQNSARDARRGLWAKVTEKDLPPYLRGRIKLPDR